eukprot:scaffold29811_cov100-Skeletonema_dohrnii-CCMP3373.AAC.1
MSKLLLDGEALEFYKWGENVNGLKDTVKGQIEELAKGWNRQERDSCIDATAAAFMGGGGINGTLSQQSNQEMEQDACNMYVLTQCTLPAR